MANPPLSVWELFLGTIIYRPYVYAFFACFAVFSIRHLRLRGFLLWTPMAWVIAFLSEYSATRNGFPFGYYRYFDETRVRELWISNVPFWDSLSFVFLAYFSWVLAAAVLKQRGTLSDALRKPQTLLLSGLLMMLLDVVIDPLTLLGDRWFLGRIYDYPTGGTYFGVTLANFAGWFFVGSVTPLVYVLLSQGFNRFSSPTPAMHPTKRFFLLGKEISELELWSVFGVYAGVFLFNLGITAWIGEWRLLAASTTITLLTLVSSGYCLAQHTSLRIRGFVKNASLKTEAST